MMFSGFCVILVLKASFRNNKTTKDCSMDDDIPEMIWLEEVDSTNRYALEHFTTISDGVMVAAATQTAGRGRHARRWISPPRQNAYVSYIVKNFPGLPHQTSWIGSMAVLDALRECVPDMRVWLKWPNDAYCGHAKIAGVLCESHATAGGLDGIVIGIGVNLNMPIATLSTIDQPATSVLKETGKPLNLEKFLLVLAKSLRRRYITGSACIDALYHEWRECNAIIGREIEVSSGHDGKTIRGKVIDLGTDGEIQLQVGDEVMRFFSGDIRIKKDSLFR